MMSIKQPVSAFTFLKQMGYDIGNSLVEDDLLEEAQHIMDEARRLGVKFYLPVDVVAAQTFSADSVSKVTSAQEIPSGWMGLDIGPATVRLYREVLSDVQTVLWNGPMGVYEMDRFARGSNKIAHFVADSYATTVVGGGDTADLVQRVNVSVWMKRSPLSQRVAVLRLNSWKVKYFRVSNRLLSRRITSAYCC
jgi:phosphoglycerate kinase